MATTKEGQCKKSSEKTNRVVPLLAGITIPGVNFLLGRQIIL